SARGLRDTGNFGGCPESWQLPVHGSCGVVRFWCSIRRPRKCRHHHPCHQTGSVPVTNGDAGNTRNQRMIDKHRCFLQWFVLMLAYVGIAFFAVQYGLPQLIFHTDVTYMTSVIAVIFTATALYLGFASWRYPGRFNRTKTRIEWLPSSTAADIGVAT